MPVASKRNGIFFRSTEFTTNDAIRLLLAAHNISDNITIIRKIHSMPEHLLTCMYNLIIIIILLMLYVAVSYNGTFTATAI